MYLNVNLSKHWGSSKSDGSHLPFLGISLLEKTTHLAGKSVGSKDQITLRHFRTKPEVSSGHRRLLLKYKFMNFPDPKEYILVPWWGLPVLASAKLPNHWILSSMWKPNQAKCVLNRKMLGSWRKGIWKCVRIKMLFIKSYFMTPRSKNQQHLKLWAASVPSYAGSYAA